MYNAFILNGSTRLKLHEVNPASSIKATGTLKQGVNTIDSFQFTIYQGNPCYGKITNLTSIVEIYKADTGARVFRGRVLTPTGKMESSGNVSISYMCEGELAYLNDSIQPYQTVRNVHDFIASVLDTHNSQVPEGKRIYLGQLVLGDLSIRSRTWYYVSSWKAITDFIEEYGGEVRLRYGSDGKRYLDYTSTVWAKGSDTKIELAVNMQSVSFTVDPTQIYSGIYAVGAKLKNDGTSAERLELKEVLWDSTLRAKYGDIVACVTWDDVTLKANLRNKAYEWLANQSGELHQYTVSAVDLSKINKRFEEFEVGTQYAIKNPLIGLDDVVRCISKTVDLNDITKCTMTFGDKYETLTSITSARNQAISSKIDTTADNITRTQSALAKQIVDNQTALLTGAEGGYVYQHLNSQGKPQEIFFLNSPDINTATQAIRINQNGIGFWSASAQTPSGSAMTGPYKNAWTIDGTFNTDYIVGRTITGFTFNNGDGTFVVNADGSVVAKNITVTGGSMSGVNTSGGSMSDIAINCGNGKFTVSSNGHVVAKDIELTGGGSTGGSFEDCYINCGNGKFVVDANGNATANSLSSNSANITGGTIDIETDDDTQDLIKLSYKRNNVTMTVEIKPTGIKLYSDKRGQTVINMFSELGEIALSNVHFQKSTDPYQYYSYSLRQLAEDFYQLQADYYNL